MNFVVLDWTIRDDKDFARTLDLTYHPNYAAVAPNSNDVVRRLLLEARSGELREMIEELLAEHGS
ncbi:MAG: hypothetical protein F4Z25_07380 [Chloroflexi bacterium]|nr:hypothetical protein [Chloroflexota bacterium]